MATAPKYSHAAAKWGGAAVDDARSSVVRESQGGCQLCGPNGIDAINGFRIDEAKWSGEDVFIARGLPGTIVVSTRFRDFTEQKALTNAHVTLTEKYVWDPLRQTTTQSR